MRVLIADGDNFQALSLTRDLASTCIVFNAGLSKFSCLSALSRFSSGFIQYDDYDILNFNKTIDQIIEKSIEVVIPTTERSCIIFNHYRKILEDNSIIICCDYQSKLDLAFDKVATFKFCKEHNFRTPKISFSLTEALNFNGDKVVVKHIKSNNILNNKLIESPPPKFIAKNELINFNIKETQFYQEYLKGNSIGFFAITKNGNIISSYSHKRILDSNPSGSGSCVRNSVLDIPTKLLNISTKIILELNWSGPLMLEFLEINGEFYLLEINGRLWGSFALNSTSNLSFSNQIINLFVNNDTLSIKHLSPKETTLTNELLLFSRWIKILRGPNKFSSTKFPEKISILNELKYLFFSKKEVLIRRDYLVILRYLCRK
jgi:hypothetical protein